MKENGQKLIQKQVKCLLWVGSVIKQLYSTLTLSGPAFSVVHHARIGGGGGVRGSNAKNHSYHKPIKIIFCMSHYSHKSMPDAKFESGGFLFLEI